MDLDLEIGGDEENSPEPIFHSIINAMGSKKEATADQIYKRIQQNEATNYSKPQVDRALANALQYGIFEVRNNRYRVRDDILDDEDTIYCQAHIKREKTPYRLQNNQRDYINPERDQHTFRRLCVSDGEGCTFCRQQTGNVEVSKSRKGKGCKQKIVNVNLRNNKCVKNSGDLQINNKTDAVKTKKFAAAKRQPVANRSMPAKRAAKTERQTDAKRRKREQSCDLPESTKYGNPHSHHSYESDSEASSKPVKRKGRSKRKNYKDEDEDEDDEEDEDEADDGDEGEEEEEDEDEDEDEEDGVPYDDQAKDRKKTTRHHSNVDCMKKEEPCASKYSARRGRSNYLCNHDFDHLANVSHETGLPNEKNFEEKNWSPNIACSKSALGRSENLQIEEWSSKDGWLVNRPQNTEGGTVKQFDNALKIEPLDSFQNMEEPSYIS